MTMRLRGKSGEAVMLILMGAMVVGGLVVWLATGHVHMMPMHGEKHTKEETVSPAFHDTREGSAASHSEGSRNADEEQSNHQNK